LAGISGIHVPAAMADQQAAILNKVGLSSEYLLIPEFCPKTLGNSADPRILKVQYAAIVGADVTTIQQFGPQRKN